LLLKGTEDLREAKSCRSVLLANHPEKVQAFVMVGISLPVEPLGLAQAPGPMMLKARGDQPLDGQ
jgi:hypothetical protein